MWEHPILFFQLFSKSELFQNKKYKNKHKNHGDLLTRSFNQCILRVYSMLGPFRGLGISEPNKTTISNIMGIIIFQGFHLPSEQLWGNNSRPYLIYYCHATFMPHGGHVNCSPAGYGCCSLPLKGMDGRGEFLNPLPGMQHIPRTVLGTE